MTAAYIKRVLYLIATVLSVAILFLTTYLTQGAWLLISAVLFMSLSFDEPLSRRAKTMLITGIAAMLLVTTGAVLAVWFPLLLLYIAIVTGVCIYLGSCYAEYAYPLFIINILTVLSLQGGAGLENGLEHAAAIFSSLVVVGCAQIIMLPYFVRDEHRYAERRLFVALGKLTTDIFNCLLEPAYPEAVYLFERRIHKQKIQCLSQRSMLVKYAPHRYDIAPGREAQIFFEVLMDIGQVRRRVADHTVFGICASELSVIEAGIVNIFNAIAAGKPYADLVPLIAELGRAIERLEETVEQVIRVASREPVVFVLFVASLKALLRQFRNMTEMPEAM